MDDSTRKKLSRNSKSAWNEAAAVQKAYSYERLLEAFRTPGYISIPRRRLNLLRKHGIEGRSVFQPCCNKGLDLLSLQNLGAARCFGFDISDEFIKQGRALADAGKIDCELIQADVYELDGSRNGQFDICLITLGTFMWMPDLDRFFAALTPLLRPNGWLLIHEFHPLSEVLRFERQQNGVRMSLAGNYFDNKPQLWTKGLDYFGGKQYDATPTYRFLHKISDIFGAMLRNGFAVESFDEFEESMRERIFRDSESCPIPRSYTLTAYYRPDGPPPSASG